MTEDTSLLAGDSLWIAREHYENFPVLSRFVPRELRRAVAQVYAFARATDDIGDEGTLDPSARLAALDLWELELDLALDGAGAEAHATARELAPDGPPAAVHPEIAAAAEAIARHDLPAEAFRALIEANRMDQTRSRYATYADLLEYCAHSADPVGRIVLALLGARDEALWPSSDAICTGLQLANHWQGLGEDLRWRDRVYVPLEDLERFGVREEDLARDRPTRGVRRLVGHLLDRTRALLDQGAGLPDSLGGRRGSVVRLFLRGGLAILDEIEVRQEDLLRGRVRLGRGRALLLVAAETLSRFEWSASFPGTRAGSRARRESSPAPW